ncbi:lyase family protein [Herbiconiux ginsengi]|uniref:3-carboxy-cis,cis-muconate cycloisomerase n=1 Tax=Herbiconiux ginsengi TaxID=381665 RepID=A0A1H3LFS6_9MICO|nr:lyase family protein [Herbiconiux ginsengi]SDY63019.1 3-carboxy-cis,cis-muconate cycloisomerase [Herbiconiux ginsengi]
MSSDALLSPLTVGQVDAVSEEAVLEALVRAEIGLVRAWAEVGALNDDAAASIAVALGWNAGAGRAGDHGIDAAALAEDSVAGGNPVIPLVPLLKRRLPPEQRSWVHRGATSQDIVDTALMLLARAAVDQVLARVEATEAVLGAFAREHRDLVGAARTLGQHAVPTTVGLRAAVWLAGLRRASARLRGLVLPAQLGGAAGTRASFHELGGGDAAAELPARYAQVLGLDDAGAPWHTTRWPVTELGDALTQATDALGVFATDVVTLTRTEIAELAVSDGGGSSAMPQKQNPVRAVLIRSAALRAPQLAATLHLAATDAADERAGGAWHTEWPTLLDLLRLALGASAHAERLASSLRVDKQAVKRNLALSRGLILAERLSLVLTPLIGGDRVSQLVAAAAAGADLGELVRALPEARSLDVDALLDPAAYIGESGAIVDRLTREDPA